MKKLYSIIFIFFSFVADAQHEYLVRIDPSNVSISVLDSIPGVNYIYVNSGTIDENSNRYFFVGTSSNQNIKKLYTLNTLTGLTIYNPALASNGPTSGNAIGLEFDNNNDTLYGLYRENNSDNWRFSWFDPLTGNVYEKNILPSSSFAIGSSTYDKNQHRYFYSDGNFEYVLDAQTGQILHSYTPAYPMVNKKFNNVDNHMYCLSNPTSSQIWEFDSVNVTNGTLHHISTLPCNNIVIYPTLKALDELNGRFFFVGYNAMNTSILYTININNGSIIHSPNFTYYGNVENLSEFAYDNVADSLFSLHWSANNTNSIFDPVKESNISMVPNPTSGDIQLTIGKEMIGEAIVILDHSGRVISQVAAHEQTITLNTFNLENGIYFIKIGNSEVVRFVKK